MGAPRRHCMHPPILKSVRDCKNCCHRSSSRRVFFEWRICSASWGKQLSHAHVMLRYAASCLNRARLVAGTLILARADPAATALHFDKQQQRVFTRRQYVPCQRMIVLSHCKLVRSSLPSTFRTVLRKSKSGDDEDSQEPDVQGW